MDSSLFKSQPQFEPDSWSAPMQSRARGREMINKPVFLVMIGICLFTLFQEIVMAETFMDEVKAVRAKNKASTVEIHDLAAKYIPVGTRKEVALKFCEENGFKIYPVRDKQSVDAKKHDESIVCSKRFLKWYVIAEDEVRVILYINSGIVAKTNGFIFLHSL